MRSRRFVDRILLPGVLCILAGLADGTRAVRAQFTDPFDFLDPAWVQNRYAPAGFTVVSFGGSNRLQLTIDATGGTASRPVAFNAPFYNTQGMQRPGGISGLWTLSAQVYIPAAFALAGATDPLVSGELWGHTGTTPAGGDYMTLGFSNASPTEEAALAGVFTPGAADRAFHFRAFDGDTGNWTNLGVPSGFVFDAWHSLSGTSIGTAFEYRIDGVLLFTDPTSAGNNLLSAMLQGYNYGQTDSYAVLWDNVTASAIPEPATVAVTAALAAMGFAVWRRRSKRG